MLRVIPLSALLCALLVPAQAQHLSVRAEVAPTVGRVAGMESLHIITRPGLYGLGVPPSGTAYAVLRGYLVRIDRDTRQVLSVVRPVTAILD